MHRTKRVPRFALAFLLLGLTAVVAHAQLPPPTPVTPILVPRGSTVPIQMGSKKLIADVQVDAPGIVQIQVDKKDPRTALVTGQNPGLVRATLTDTDKGQEVLEFTVQTDVEYLKYILRRAVPTASIEPIPSANNAFILTGTVQKAEDVQIVVDTVRSVVGDRVINALRVGGVQQVEICVTVARVARSEARSMGFSFLETGQNHFVSSILSAPLALTGTNLPAVTSATAGLAGAPNISFGIVNQNQGFLGFLEALRNNNLVKVLAEPKLITLSGRPAEFISGGEQAVPTLASGSAGGGAVSGVEFRPFGTTVRFLPIVLGDGKIYMEVEPQFTFPDPSNLFSAPIPGTNAVVFGRTTQRVRTSVVLEDGQTFAIGGMVFRSINGTSSRVPVLGDLPFLGTAFSQINYTESEEELLVLVTPHLVDPLDCNQMPKYLPGQETRSPDDFELFLERILEAPRGPRRVCQRLCYVPAYKNDPTASVFPCSTYGHCVHGRCDYSGLNPGSACGSLAGPPLCVPPGIGHGHNGCGNGGCGNGGCGNGGCGCGNGNGQVYGDGHGIEVPAGTPLPGPLPSALPHGEPLQQMGSQTAVPAPQSRGGEQRVPVTTIPASSMPGTGTPPADGGGR
jgi:pilus assembly protein CpaC